MKKYLKIILILIKMNLQNALVYRVNVLLMLIMALIMIFSRLFSIQFIYENVEYLGGYTYQEVFVLTLLTSSWWFSHMFIGRKSLESVGTMINNGMLDFYLIKPIKLTRIIPFLKVDFRQPLVILVALSLALSKINIWDLGLLRLLASSLLFINGVIIFYLFVSILMVSTFWSGRSKTVHHFIPTLIEVTKYPSAFFFGVFKFGFTFIIPVILMVNPAFHVLFRKEKVSMIISAFAMSLALYIINKILWQKGLKNYSSAN